MTAHLAEPIDDTSDSGRRRWSSAGQLGLPLLHALAAVLPVLAAVVALRLWVHRGVGDYTPWQSDELSYWSQIRTFSAVGFDNGYYTIQEVPASILSAYGPWGPAFPALYGTLLRPFGMSLNSVLILNLIVFPVLVTLALRIGRMSWRRTLVFAVVLATFTPLLRQLVTGMQEPLHFALAVLLGVLFHRLITAPSGKRAAPFGWVLCGVFAASLIRPTWAMLLIPAALLAYRGSRRRMVIGACAGAVGAVLLAMLFALWSAPYPFTDFAQIRTAGSVNEKLTLLTANIHRNILMLPRVREMYIHSEPVQRYQLMAFIVVAAIAAVVAWRRRDTHTVAVATTVGLSLALPLGLIVTLYNFGNGMRVLSSHVLLTATLLCLSRIRWAQVLPALLIVTNVLTVSWFQHDLVAFNQPNFRQDPRRIAEFGAELSTELRHQPNADPWCNTLLLATEYGFLPELAGVPSGIGVSVDFNHQFNGGLKSAYVLAQDTTLPLLPDKGAHLVPLKPTSRGTLYRNNASPCFTSPS